MCQRPIHLALAHVTDCAHGEISTVEGDQSGQKDGRHLEGALCTGAQVLNASIWECAASAGFIKWYVPSVCSEREKERPVYYVRLLAHVKEHDSDRIRAHLSPYMQLRQVVQRRHVADAGVLCPPCIDICQWSMLKE